MGHTLRHLMAEQSMTWVVLQDRTGMAPSTLNSLLQGKSDCKVSTLYKLADAFDVSPCVFL
jgi:predicted transcriptional regulator